MKPFSCLLSTAALSSLTSAQFFNVMTLRSASPIHFARVNANGGSLWIDNPQSKYCPPIESLDCPNTTGMNTAYGGGIDGRSLNLAVQTPGGQADIGYTLPHSASTTPGAILDGSSINAARPDLPYLRWGINGTGAEVIFCPEPASSTVGPWHAYAVLDNVTYPNGCLGASLIAVNTTGPHGYEYTG